MGKKTWKVGLDRKGKDFRRFIREGDDLDSVLQALREEYPEYKGGGSIAQVAEEGEDLDEWLKLPGSQWHKGVNDKPNYEVVNDFAIDAIKDNFTPPGAKSKKEDVKDDDDLEVENLKEKYVNSKPSREENVPGENYKRYPSFMKKKADDELDEYLKDLDKYLSKNPKGREDIPATYKR